MKENKKGCVGGFKERDGKGKMLFYQNFKK